MRRLLLLALLALLALVSPAVGQSTQPSADPWSTTVSAFARSLADNDPAAVLPWLADNVAVQAFHAKTADAVRLLARVRGGTLVMARAYVQIPTAMAADVAEGFRSAAVADEIKVKMTPANETQMRRANQIAGQWLAETLPAKNGDLVGAIVFCCARETPGKTGTTGTAGTAGTAGTSPDIVFVLVKGTAADSDRPRIDTIVFGDPRPPAK